MRLRVGLMNKVLVYILGGGTSAERGVSLKTAQCFSRHIDRRKYAIVQITISKQGVWTYREYGQLVKILPSELEVWLKGHRPDVVLLGLHGTGAEDGQIQQFLDKLGIKYTGSGATASTEAFDKVVARERFVEAGLNVAPAVVVTSAQAQGVDDSQSRSAKLTYPLFVKPTQSGSSFGISKVASSAELERAIRQAHKYAQDVLIEEGVQGRELSCGVVQNGEAPIVLPPTEIRPSDHFFSYKAKYSAPSEGGATEITPAPLSAALIEQVQAVATLAHSALGCRGITRTDMILTVKGDLVVLETNTLPGMTTTSLIPQQAEVAGLSIAKLIDLLIADALVK